MQRPFHASIRPSLRNGFLPAARTRSSKPLNGERFLGPYPDVTPAALGTA